MRLERIATLTPDADPLVAREVPRPEPGPGEVRIRVTACGVCHTELDEIEGRTAPPRLPVTPGHEVVGRVEAMGEGAERHAPGSRVGVGWIHHSDGSADENLSLDFRATGRDVDGGYAEFMTVPEAYAHPLPDGLSDEETAPLLCAGAVGFRALRHCELRNGEALGLTGFGGSAHLVLALARHLLPASPIYVFARDAAAREFALAQGATWSGDTHERPPHPPGAIIDTTPAWRPVVEALAALAPGGRLVINAIRKEDADKDCLREIDYATHLWHEKQVRSVANLCGADIEEFLALAARIPIHPTVEIYPLAEANRALRDLRFEPVRGAKVLRIAG